MYTLHLTLYLQFDNNCEHEYIIMSTYCCPLTKYIIPDKNAKFRNFIHDHSGFYTLLESYIGINRALEK